MINKWSRNFKAAGCFYCDRRQSQLNKVRNYCGKDQNLNDFYYSNDHLFLNDLHEFGGIENKLLAQSVKTTCWFGIEYIKEFIKNSVGSGGMIYCFWYGSFPLYVGKTDSNGWNRINSYVHGYKNTVNIKDFFIKNHFNQLTLEISPQKFPEKCEKWLIKKYRPPFNYKLNEELFILNVSSYLKSKIKKFEIAISDVIKKYVMARNLIIEQINDDLWKYRDMKNVEGNRWC